MEAGNILSADVLDIIFDARNKEYGAYDLRKNYQRRLMKALVSTVLIVALLLIAYLLGAAIKPQKEILIVKDDINLAQIAPPDQPLTPPPPPPPPPPVPSVKMIALTAPLIVKDDQVKPEEMPPVVDDLVNTKIGLINSDGADDKGIVAPPVAAATAVVTAPKKAEDDAPFTRVEIESQYPGGMSAWAAFVGRNLVYPQEAIDIERQGTVTVKFIVDTEGNVSEVMAISGPEELRAAAVKVIKKSGKWEPAIQNGRKVKSYKNQPITFRLSE